MLRQSLNVSVPGIGTHCDIHARYDASGPAWVGVYDRDRQSWHTTSGEGPGACYALLAAGYASALAVLEARTVPSC